ncbi:MAG: lytic murein transglycosylase B [Pseudomonadota bacterium]
MINRYPFRPILTGIMLLSLCVSEPLLASVSVGKYPALVRLVDVMVAEDGYPRDELVSVLEQANVDQKIIDLMNRQYESLPWYKYRKLFINDDRIRLGVEFWQENKSTLQAVEREYGVPQRILVALIGVETHYGRRLGGERVLDALVTLTADFPRRSKFFGKELRTFLNTTRKEGIDPTAVLGSFAGAIGIPQFMPTSYEAYAVDFNANGKRDLVNEVEDAIGSVGNYLAVHGWNRQQKIFSAVAEPLSESGKEMVTRRAKPKLTMDALSQAGVRFDSSGASKKAALLGLTQENGKRYFVGFRNFYAITRYNPSVNYAMAITELSHQIDRRRQSQ